MNRTKLLRPLNKGTGGLCSGKSKQGYPNKMFTYQ